MKPITITVLGLPKPAGSKRAFVLRGRDGSILTRANGSPIVNVTDDCKKSKGWKEQVSRAAYEQTIGEPLTGALFVTMTFVMPRPKGHYGSGKNANLLKPNAPKHPTVKPDVLKLSRAAEDALTGIIYKDDSQTVELLVRKRYGSPPRCEIKIESPAEETLLD